MKIAVAGTGYVGLSLATLLSQKYEVVALDIMKEKVDMINQRISPIKDELIESFFKENDLHLTATLDYKKAFFNASYIIISTPTNYDEERNFFDTSSVEDVIKKVIALSSSATMVVKSTIPVGFIDNMKEKYKIERIFFAPEFLREGKALYDNLYPSRIILGDKGKEAVCFANMLRECSLKKDVPILYMENKEAEAVKLFANTFLALRVAYFNELDTYAEIKGLNTKNIIDGVCLDPRIGHYYNNPSFGYGGYCLPKDTKQLLANYKDVPENLIQAIVLSNETRKKHIVSQILKTKPQVVGIFRLTMKSGSDNFRASAILDIIDLLKQENVKILIFEPTLHTSSFNDCQICNDLFTFKENSEIIVANRMEDVLKDVFGKVYTRDIFQKD